MGCIHMCSIYNFSNCVRINDDSSLSSGETKDKKGEKMARESYIAKELKSFKRVNTVAEYALDRAQELGLTQQEAEAVPERISDILKWERCKDEKKYERPPQNDTAGAKELKILW